MKKLLITGAGGFIGKNLAEIFAPAYSVSAPLRAELDFCDDKTVREYFAARHFDAVIHCAIKPGHRNAKDPSGQLYANTRMFFNLVSQEAHFGKLIFISSGMVYDKRRYKPKMAEDFFGSSVPEDEGGLSKYVLAKHIADSRNMIELRPFGVYGKYEDCAIRFISNAICRTLAGLPITMRQNRRFDYVSVEDLAAVVAHFIEHEPKFRAYNVAPDKAIELAELAELVRSISGSKLPVDVAEPGLGVEYSGDNSRLKAEMPGFAFTPIEDGVRRLYDWYRTNPDRINVNALLLDKR